jgi:hypothetical protein
MLIFLSRGYFPLICVKFKSVYELVIVGKEHFPRCLTRRN